MISTAGMKLVFRLGRCGFSLPVEDLIEIQENSAGLIDASAADPDRQHLGELFHRGEKITVRDFGARMQIAEPGKDDGRAILVLADEESRWGMLVDRVEGLFPKREFEHVSLPPLISGPEPRPYAALDRWRGELLVFCEARRVDAAWGSR